MSIATKRRRIAQLPEADYRTWVSGVVRQMERITESPWLSLADREARVRSRRSMLAAMTDEITYVQAERDAMQASGREPDGSTVLRDGMLRRAAPRMAAAVDAIGETEEGTGRGD